MIMYKKISAFATSMALLISSAAFIPAAVHADTENSTDTKKSVDLSSNEQLFPPVFNQGNIGSCVAAATTYYQFTYEARKALLEKNKYAQTDFSYSPASVYPQINGGTNEGSWEYRAYHVLRDRGALTLDEMPYDPCLDIRFYIRKSKDEIESFSEPQGINYITEGDETYKDLMKIGIDVSKSDIYEIADTVNGIPRYRRKGTYIKPQEYIYLDPSEKQYYVPVYAGKDNDTAIELYWRIGKTYLAVPRDEKALFNALSIRLDSYEGCSLCSPISDHKCKSVITEYNTEEWNTSDPKKIENQFIEKIKSYLDEGKVVAASSRFNYLHEYGKTHLRNNSGCVVFQNVAFYGKAFPNKEEDRHEFTIVGYDDSIECDINNNHIIDPGETGAFKIVNSWGTGWGDKGFVWVMYDAVRKESAVEDCPDPTDEAENGKGTYKRYPAIEEAYKIDVSAKDIKLVSEVDLITPNYYKLKIDNYCNHSQKITNHISPDYCNSSVVFSGPVFTDITNICGRKINGNDYTVKISHEDNNSSMAVQAIRLKDDKGNTVCQARFDNVDNYHMWVNHNNPLEYSLGVNIEKGDLNYDHILDMKDYDMITNYFNIISENIDEAKKDQAIKASFSSLQLELLDENDDGVIDKEDLNSLTSKIDLN